MRGLACRFLIALALSAFAIGAAKAQTSVVRWALVPVDATRNDPALSLHTTQALCDAAARTLNRTRTYTCERRLDVTAAVVVPPPTPVCTAPQPAASQTVACPSGTTGSWTQTRSVTQAAYPVCWTTGAYAPTSAPAGACTPIVTPPPPPPTTGLTYVNPALVPAASTVGVSSEYRVANTGAQPYRDPDGMGAFRTVCQWSHFNFDDPLVYPGQVGASHLHMFFGNTGTTGNSTPESIRTTGNGSCRGGIANRTAYWVPAVIDTRSGAPVRPAADIDVYYKRGYGVPESTQVVAPPVGFRMIAGNSKSTVGQQDAYFECNGSRISGMTCGSGELRQVVEFPQCWDGINLDSPDHRSHVIYPSGGRCAATHPVVLPEITVIVKYAVPSGGTGSWRLSSDVIGAPAGSSGHADWVNGWVQNILESGMTNIVNRGLSGGSHMIGDGRVLY